MHNLKCMQIRSDGKGTGELIFWEGELTHWSQRDAMTRLEKNK